MLPTFVRPTTSDYCENCPINSLDGAHSLPIGGANLA
jgi:hypothetical protein